MSHAVVEHTGRSRRPHFGITELSVSPGHEVPVTPAPLTVVVWVALLGPSKPTNATRVSPAILVENAFVDTVPRPSWVVEVSIDRPPELFATTCTFSTGAVPTLPFESVT